MNKKWNTPVEETCSSCGNDGNYNPLTCECVIADQSYYGKTNAGTRAIKMASNWWDNQYVRK